MNNWAKIGLGIGALWLAFRIAAKGLVVGVSNVLLKGLDIANGKAQVQINVSVRNPLPVGVKVNDVVGEVYVGNTQVGYVNTQLNYLCSGEKTHVLPVIVNLTSQGLGQALWNNIQTGNINNLVISFDGALRVTKLNIRVPLELQFRWSDLV